MKYLKRYVSVPKITMFDSLVKTFSTIFSSPGKGKAMKNSIVTLTKRSKSKGRHFMFYSLNKGKHFGIIESASEKVFIRLWDMLVHITCMHFFK